MAENESLDLSSSDAKRWHRVCQVMRCGRPLENVARRVEDALYGGYRAAVKQLDKRGVPFQALLKAVQLPGGFDQLPRQGRGHPYAPYCGMSPPLPRTWALGN